MGLIQCLRKGRAEAANQPQFTHDKKQVRDQLEMAARPYLETGDQKIDWYEFADLVELAAQSSPNDEVFRQVLWEEFGSKGRLHPHLDDQNQGLPKGLHNSGYHDEQMHHYLGGVTGKANSKTHCFNNAVLSRVHEIGELSRTGRYNKGDVRLFKVSRPHRDDFVNTGRHTVAPNIRKLLLPKP